MTWSETCRMYREKYPTIRKEQLKPDPTREANVYAVVEALSSRLDEDQITVVGNGSACVVGGHAYIMKKGQRFLSNSAIASMGYDLPQPSARVWRPMIRSLRGTATVNMILSC